MKGSRTWWLAAVALIAACAPGTTGPPPAETPTTAPSVAEVLATPSPTPIKFAVATRHVFVIVMENTSLVTALQSPAIAKLASTYTLAANYHAVASPSLPNYLALTSGSTWGVRDNGYHALPAGGLGAQLTAAGISWRAYMEGLTDAGCMRSPYPYALKHNPFAYYGGGCPENVVPLDALDADLTGDTPRFVWITPGLCHDGHDCALSDAAAWLDDQVSRITASPAWRANGVLFIVWDEGDGRGGDVVPLIAVSPGQAGSRSDAQFDHYSLLATIEDLFRLPRLGAAEHATPLTELLPPREP